MSLLDLLSQPSVWEEFYEYKKDLACTKQFVVELRRFIDDACYLPVCEGIREGRPFPLPARSVISKMGSEKKRIVYTYPSAENTVLKLLTWLILRRYDSLFSRGLYSFRPGRNAKDAVRYLLRHPEWREMYSYKVDIHDYFNSVPVEQLLPLLANALADDAELFSFLSSLLREPWVWERGKEVRERKGIMAGTPVSSFYANLFLAELDRWFSEQGILYVRYSDDILCFAPTREEAEQYREYIHRFLEWHSLEVNPSKESFSAPGEGFVFLGFLCEENCVDIAPATVKKLKQKMRRKRDALRRWQKRNETDGERAAKAFVRAFNRKLLENAGDNELCWSSWFFPVINTTESLHAIDEYAQDCIRYLVSGRHTKSRFNVRYEEIKRLGYRSLVHEYYTYRDQAKNRENEQSS